MQTWTGCTAIPTYDNDYRDPTKPDIWHYINEHLEIDDPVVSGPYTITVEGKSHTYQAVGGENPSIVKAGLLAELANFARDLASWVRDNRHLIQKPHRSVSRNRSAVPV